MSWTSWSAVCATKSERARPSSIPFAALAMFSKLLDKFARTFSFRLNLWYASIFTVSACAFYLFLYVLLAVSMERKDRETLEAQVKEYSVVYHGGGLAALKSVVNANRQAKKQQPFVRVVHPQGGVLFQSVPDDWIAFDPKVVQVGNVKFQQAYIRIPRDAERDFTIAATTLFDGLEL